jgi:Fuc2NAc and GlcNAc transferase
MFEAFLIVPVALFSGAAGAVIIYKFGRKIASLDVPNERSSHSIPTPRGGGVGIWLAFMIVGILYTEDRMFIGLTGTAGLVGLLEDRLSLQPRLRLLLQLIISIVIVSMISTQPVSIMAVGLFLFWIVFITGTANFYNFMDGIDGIAGLTGVIGFGLTAFFAFAVVHEPDVALMSLALSAGCLGFLPFNFPKAKVFMGDVGSIFLGFVFAVFVMRLSVTINIFFCLIMFLSTFYADAILTIFYRWKDEENLMKAHRRHLYQYLGNECGVPHWKISSIYALTQAVIGLLALYAYTSGLVWQIVVFAVFGGIFITVYKVLKEVKPGFTTIAKKELSL